MTASDTESVMTIDQVAAMVKCSPAHVRRLVNRGEFPAPARLGALVRWDRFTVLRWLAQNTGATVNRGGKVVQVRG